MFKRKVSYDEVEKLVKIALANNAVKVLDYFLSSYSISISESVYTQIVTDLQSEQKICDLADKIFKKEVF